MVRKKKKRKKMRYKKLFIIKMVSNEDIHAYAADK